MVDESSTPRGNGESPLVAESCGRRREAFAEALTEEAACQPWSREIGKSGMPGSCMRKRTATRTGAQCASTATIPRIALH